MKMFKLTIVGSVQPSMPWTQTQAGQSRVRSTKHISVYAQTWTKQREEEMGSEPRLFLGGEGPSRNSKCQ